MGRILAVLCISFLAAASAASARTLQQEADGTAPTKPLSDLAAAIEAAQTTANVSLFVWTFEAANLATIIENETLVEAYTILAPTNEAIIAALPLFNLTVDQLRAGADANRASTILATLLNYHIMPEGAFTKEQLAGYTSLTPALTLFGGFPTAGNLTITAPEAASGDVIISGAGDSNATVVVPDIQPPGQTPPRRLGRRGKDSKSGKSFIVHIVDGVLLPPAEVLANATTLDAGNATVVTTLPGTAALAPGAGPEDNTTLADAGKAEGNTTTPAAGDGTMAAADNGTGTNATTPAEGTPIGIVVPAAAANVSAPVLAESIANGTVVPVLGGNIPNITGSPAPATDGFVDGVLLPPAEVLANGTTLDADNATTLPGNATLAPDAGPEDNTTVADAGPALNATALPGNASLAPDAPLKPLSELAAAIEAAQTTANVSLAVWTFVAADLATIIENETFVEAYTILAPTNEAIIAALPLFNLTVDQIRSLREGGDVTRASSILATLLNYHILPEGAFTKKELAGFTSLTPALTLFGGFPTAGNLTISAPEAASGNVTIAGAGNSKATVVVPDIQPPGQTSSMRLGRRGKDSGKSFVVHIVDGVLLPPADIIARFTTK